MLDNHLSMIFLVIQCTWLLFCEVLHNDRFNCLCMIDFRFYGRIVSQTHLDYWC